MNIRDLIPFEDAGPPSPVLAAATPPPPPPTRRLIPLRTIGCEFEIEYDDAVWGNQPPGYLVVAATRADAIVNYLISEEGYRRAVETEIIGKRTYDAEWQQMLEFIQEQVANTPDALRLVHSTGPQRVSAGHARVQRFRERQAVIKTHQKEVVTLMKDLLNRSAPIVAHVGHVSDGAARRVNRLVKQLNGGVVRTSAGVALPNILPPAAAVHAGERQLVDVGVVQELQEVTDGAVAWARSPLVLSAQQQLEQRLASKDALGELLRERMPDEPMLIYNVHGLSWLDATTPGAATPRTRMRFTLLDPDRQLWADGVAPALLWADVKAGLHAAALVFSEWRAADLHALLTTSFLIGNVSIRVLTVFVSADHEGLAVEAGLRGGNAPCRCSFCLLPVPLAPYASRCGVPRDSLDVLEQLHAEQQRAEAAVASFTQDYGLAQKATEALTTVARKLSGNFSGTPLLSAVLHMDPPIEPQRIRFVVPVMHDVRHLGEAVLRVAQHSTAALDRFVQVRRKILAGRDEPRSAADVRRLINACEQLADSDVPLSAVVLLRLASGLFATLYQHDRPTTDDMLRCAAYVFTLCLGLETFHEGSTANLYLHTLCDHLLPLLSDLHELGIPLLHILEEEGERSFAHLKAFERTHSNRHTQVFQRAAVRESLEAAAVHSAPDRPWRDTVFYDLLVPQCFVGERRFVDGLLRLLDAVARVRECAAGVSVSVVAGHVGVLFAVGRAQAERSGAAVPVLNMCRCGQHTVDAFRRHCFVLDAQAWLAAADVDRDADGAAAVSQRALLKTALARSATVRALPPYLVRQMRVFIDPPVPHSKKLFYIEDWLSLAIRSSLTGGSDNAAALELDDGADPSVSPAPQRPPPPRVKGEGVRRRKTGDAVAPSAKRACPPLKAAAQQPVAVLQRQQLKDASAALSTAITALGAFQEALKPAAPSTDVVPVPRKRGRPRKVPLVQDGSKDDREEPEEPIIQTPVAATTATAAAAGGTPAASQSVLASQPDATAASAASQPASQPGLVSQTAVVGTAARGARPRRLPAALDHDYFTGASLESDQE